MTYSLQLARRIGQRDGTENQRLELAGKPFLTEDEAAEAWLRRTGGDLAAVDPALVDAYRAGYGAGADAVQRAQPLDPRKQREALAVFARLSRELTQF